MRALKTTLDRFVSRFSPVAPAWTFPNELEAWQACVLAHPHGPTDRLTTAVRKRRIERLLRQELPRNAAQRLTAEVWMIMADE